MTTHPNILLIILDSVRASRLSCYGHDRETTPNIDKFAESSTLYETAISEGCWTVPSHASIFTGKPSTEHQAHAENRIFEPDSETIAEVLSGLGYNTYGSSRNGWVTSENGFDQGFDAFHDRDHAQIFEEEFDIRSAIRRHEDKSTPHRYSAFVKDALLSGYPVRALANLGYFKYRDTSFCDDGASINNRFAKNVIDNEEEPWFLFLNYMEGHEPYYAKSAHKPELLPEESPPRSAFDGPAKWDYHAGRSEPPFDDLKSLYDAEIRLLDERIGKLLNTLEVRNELDDTLVIIAGDHGQHFGEHNLMGHVASPFPEAIHVPLIISDPDQDTKSVESAPVSLKSIFEKIESTAAGNVSKADDLTSESVISHCFGSHEQVYDDYPELDQKKWNENLITKIVQKEEEIYGFVRGEYGRENNYQVTNNKKTFRVDEFLNEREEAELNTELEMMESVSSENSEEVSDRLKDLGYL